MKKTEMEANLHCTRCQEETLHSIVYVNDQMKSVECTECHQKISVQVDIMKEFYKEVYEKIATKPKRVTQEYKANLNGFISRLPIRVLSKPYRLMRYLNESYKVIKQYKK
ncbi:MULTISPECIES: bh protein [Bacillus]|uniref:bh protein n=1 Tax=Bacillus TaxID=1386 RepID=UPI000B453BC2|nr:MULTISPECIES: bh protein [Bacillus]MBU8640516.1 bh protein [Bacillus pumilus]MBU8698270.1 bh protein [Bacillus pumilus]OUZ07748.1 bh protein [Bacillus pumilus]PRR92148.1 bh protein [Bacillus sp. NMCN1]PRR99777.1 bh protein [Bacillus sp. NMCN6]